MKNILQLKSCKSNKKSIYSFNTIYNTDNVLLQTLRTNIMNCFVFLKCLKFLYSDLRTFKEHT